MKKIVIILGVLIAVAAGAILFVTRSDRGGKTISSFEDCVAAGFPVMESFPRQCRAGDRTFIEGDKPALGGSEKIRVTTPSPDAQVLRPLVVEGEARGTWFFEASFPVTLLDANGAEIGSGIAEARGEWMTEDFVPFRAVLYFNPPKTERGVLVLKRDNPSGLPENDEEFRVAVTFPAAPQIANPITVQVFFSQQNSGGFDCGDVAAVSRTIERTNAPARAALEELFRGPTGTESRDGYFTSINPGVRIRSLAIENGVARVDLSPELEREVGGSCRVAAIRAQITETLKQFPTVKSVVISIDGRTEDILQP